MGSLLLKSASEKLKKRYSTQSCHFAKSDMGFICILIVYRGESEGYRDIVGVSLYLAIIY